MPNNSMQLTAFSSRLCLHYKAARVGSISRQKENYHVHRAMACLRCRICGASHHSWPDDPYGHKLLHDAWSACERAARRCCCSRRLNGLGGVASRLRCTLGNLGFLVYGRQMGRRAVLALPRYQTPSRWHFYRRAVCASRAGISLEAIREHLPSHRAQSEGHRLLRCLSATVHQSKLGRHPTALGSCRHVRSNGRAQRNAVCSICWLGAKAAGIATDAAALQPGRWLAAFSSWRVGTPRKASCMKAAHPTIEWTPFSGLCLLPGAAHVKR